MIDLVSAFKNKNFRIKILHSMFSLILSLKLTIPMGGNEILKDFSNLEDKIRIVKNLVIFVLNHC